MRINSALGQCINRSILRKISKLLFSKSQAQRGCRKIIGNLWSAKSRPFSDHWKSEESAGVVGGAPNSPSLGLQKSRSIVSAAAEMGASLVDRATNDELIGPDWAMNIGICDIINHDPGQAKDVAKGIKKRLASRNSKVQLLALTLLETVMKNCGDVAHMQVAEKGILHEMVKIVKKKNPDLHVKEKILVFIDMWQEAFGGSRARFPQYHAAYRELLRLGAVFPERSERPAPNFTHPQTQPLTSYPPNLRNVGFGEDLPETSIAADFPTLSLTEIQNARGIMDVFSEMMNALDPANSEGLKQEVVVELVQQCRSYKQRVVQVVNSTSDEKLLAQSLTLNDDLERVLAKHDAIAAGTAIRSEKLKSVQAVIDIDSKANNKDSNSQPNQRSSASTISVSPFEQLALPAPPASSVPATSPAKVAPYMDLLSGDDYKAPAADLMSLVPVSQPVTSPSSYRHSLALVDLFPQNHTNNSNVNASGPFRSSATYPFSQTQSNATPSQHQKLPRLAQQPAVYLNGGFSNVAASQFGQAGYVQGTQIILSNPTRNGQQQSFDSGMASGLPPPPWAPQSVQPQAILTNQMGMINTTMMHTNPVRSFDSMTQSYPIGGLSSPSPPATQITGMLPQAFLSNHFGTMYFPQMQFGHVAGAYPRHGGSHVYLPRQHLYGMQAPFYDQMGTSFQFPGSNHLSSSSYQLRSSSFYSPQSNKSQKQEDKLFGDLVSMAKAKTSTSNISKVGST
ncbi:hypothetical protein AXF42_Ash001148 [Apostasia shenzhenica]|uniref:TOM1-like protein 2 n=1 Tax=Apostasia shenzhenica TaxID=1088818 RepID=A0A2I0AU30_9ASPA|nr:hypothetical protein AXF42_Ash001148 [Apostasia shenzhenica]